MNQFQAFLTLLFSVCTVHAFHIPSPLVAKPTVASLPTAPSFPLVSDGNDRWVIERSGDFLIADGGALDVVRNVALGITAILFLLAGVTYLYASFIIPAAAQELEKECKELDPQLWDAYQAKLGEGETMGTRPDLMQELGSRLQPLLEAKIAAMENDKLTPLQTTMNPMGSAPTKTTTEGPPIPISTGDQWDSNDDVVIDAVIEKPTTDKKK